jgi:hypothetical protein
MKREGNMTTKTKRLLRKKARRRPKNLMLSRWSLSRLSNLPFFGENVWKRVSLKLSAISAGQAKKSAAKTELGPFGY